MKVRYFGKKIVRNEFGDVVRTEWPTVEIDCKASELAMVGEMLETTGYAFDLFRDGDIGAAYVEVSDREDANEFMAVWKEAKRAIKEGV